MSSKKSTQEVRFADREAWLTEATAIVFDGIVTPAARTVFADQKIVAPQFRISLGFGKFSRGKKGILAQCFARRASTDGVNEIFITPELESPLDVLPAIVHEAIHAQLDPDLSHGTAFRRMMPLCGLEGPSTATTASLKLIDDLRMISDALGAFPHKRMDFSSVHQKDGTRQLKVSCSRCSFIARTSAKHIARWKASTPACPVCSHPLTFPD